MTRIQLLICLLASALSMPTLAFAEVVVFVSSDPRAAELAEELDRELHGFGHTVTRAEAGLANTAEQRRNAAAMRALEKAAAAAVWIETDAPTRVRALAVRRDVVEDAPVTVHIDDIAPRVFANLATSAVLHVLARANPGGAAGPDVDSAPPGPTNSAPNREDLRTSTAPGSRFYARVGGTLGFAYLHNGQELDSSLTSSTLTNASANGSADSGTTRRNLARAGYECAVSTDANGNVVANNCAVAVDAPGFVATGAAEFVAGVMATERLGLGVSARVRGGTHKRVLGRALLGLTAEYEMLAPQELGATLRLLGGFGYGRVSAAPKSSSAALQRYVTSGVWEAHAGLLAGYRITRHFGVYGCSLVRTLFPAKMWVIDSSIGLEVRL